MENVKLSWSRHPTILGIGVLGLICALMVGQKFIQFSESPGYELSRSLFFNLMILVPFALCVVAGFVVRTATSHWHWRYRALALAVSGVVLIALYFVAISGLLYALGMLSEWPSQAFLKKYTSGPMHVHAAFFVLMMFVQSTPDKRQTAQSRSVAAADVFGVPLDEILAIEADDHYVWIHSRHTSALERITINKLAANLPPHFLRVHRSHIVNLNQVDGLVRNGRIRQLRLGNHLVPVSTSHRAELEERLPGK